VFDKPLEPKLEIKITKTNYCAPTQTWTPSTPLGHCKNSQWKKLSIIFFLSYWNILSIFFRLLFFSCLFCKIFKHLWLSFTDQWIHTFVHEGKHGTPLKFWSAVVRFWNIRNWQTGVMTTHSARNTGANNHGLQRCIPEIRYHYIFQATCKEMRIDSHFWTEKEKTFTCSWVEKLWSNCNMNQPTPCNCHLSHSSLHL
jgi:hypothetical protein